MSRSVFTYGSLMFTEVWSLVVAGRYRAADARLDRHARCSVVDQTYPGMVLSPDAQVAGVVYFDVDDADVARLDHFEGDDYRRDRVTVTLADGTTTAAETYVYLHVDRLLAAPWEPHAFALQRFIDTYCRARLDP